MVATAFLIMQFIISAKAGLVNAVEGTSNVHVQQQVPAGSPIQTGPAGRVEILLNPGTFLRLGEDSQVVLDSVDLTDIQVRVLSGSAIIECNSVEKNSPIRVTDGTETLSIAKPGTYRFPEDAASASLDDWNQQRSDLIAAVNKRSADTDSASVFQPQGLPMYPGGLWPNSLAPGYGSPYGSPYGSFLTPFAFFPAFAGGYRFYQPLVSMSPYAIYPPVIVPPVIRPLPRPVPVVPRPTTTPRPIAPGTSRPGPPRLGGHVAAHGHR